MQMALESKANEITTLNEHLAMLKGEMEQLRQQNATGFIENMPLLCRTGGQFQPETPRDGLAVFDELQAHTEFVTF